MKMVGGALKLKKKARGYILRLAAQKVLGLFFYLAGSGRLMNTRAWVYFALYFLTGLAIIPVYKLNPEILVQRGKIVTGSPRWDKVLLALYWLLDFFIIYLIAGAEAEGKEPLTAMFWAGTALLLVSAALSLAAVLANPFLESTARIQTERGQRVISDGVYALVRHPAYLAILLFCLARVFIFATPLTGVTAGVIGTIIVIRTGLEDRMLKVQLEGYAEYSRKTKYRLLPFIW